MRTLAIVFAACLLIVPTSVWGQPSSGLIANPNPLTINVPAGAGPSSQVVNITFNGSPVMIFNLSASTTTGQNWLQAFSPSTGVVTTTVNPAGLSGSFFGTVVVNTITGSITFQVNLTVGIPPPVTPAPTSLILVLTGLAAVALYQMRRRRFSVAIR